MPTFREDLHLGHEVATVETDDLTNKSVTGDKIADRVIDWFHILAKAIHNEHIGDEAVDNRTLSDNAVDTRNLRDDSVTPSKVSSDFVDTLVAPLIDALRRKHDTDVDSLKAKDKDLQNQIDSLEIAGVAVSNEFGTDPHISISQKTMTDAINKLWQKLEDMTGEVLQGISMSVTPDYFISEDGCSVHISANTVETNGIFEHIAFYGNGSLIAEADNVDFFEYDTEITETTIIKCVAKIMGVEYTRQQIVTHYNSFWLGAGNAYSDIMDVEHVIPITNGMRGAYDVDVAQGQHIIIIVGESLAGGFLRADLNSVEINFTESTVTVDGKNYKVFTSEEAYSAGTYNIDINDLSDYSFGGLYNHFSKLADYFHESLNVSELISAYTKKQSLLDVLYVNNKNIFNEMCDEYKTLLDRLNDFESRYS